MPLRQRNHRTAKRIPALQTLLTFAGLEPERLRLDWVSASEGERFTRTVTEFTDSVRALGPARWHVSSAQHPVRSSQLSVPYRNTHAGDLFELPSDYYQLLTGLIQDKARELEQQVACVICHGSATASSARYLSISRADNSLEPGLYTPMIAQEKCTCKPAVDPHWSHNCKPCELVSEHTLVENQFAREQACGLWVCPGVVESARSRFSFQSLVLSPPVNRFGFCQDSYRILNTAH
jgi:hypothetical protein